VRFRTNGLLALDGSHTALISAIETEIVFADCYCLLVCFQRRPIGQRVASLNTTSAWARSVDKFNASDLKVESSMAMESLPFVHPHPLIKNSFDRSIGTFPTKTIHANQAHVAKRHEQKGSRTIERGL
jgi:hypothetical protein